MARYIEAPENYDFSAKNGSRTLFLGGGITNCVDWQQEVTSKICDLPQLTILNPRRKEWPMGDPEAGLEQIRWEYLHLRDCDAITFWFTADTIQPIVLFELGRWSSLQKKLFVGCDPNYERRFDIEVQLGLSCPDLKIHFEIDELVKDIREYFWR